MAERGSAQIREQICLQWLTGPLAGQKLTVSNQRLTIGRDPALCNVVADSDGVSRQHATLEIAEHDTIVVTDLGSMAGTFVNGEAVKRRILRDGDVIALGSPSVSAMLRAGSQGPPQTGVFKPATRNTGQSVLQIGRWMDNEIVLDAPGVSRHHAKIEYDAGSPPVLTDLGSTNGTFVNGEIIDEARAISADDLISIGGFVLRVQGPSIKWHNLNASRISAWGVTKAIEGKTIIKDISLAISPRQFIGLIGPSGCGKTTLMNALSGLRPATEGRVYINELDLYHNFSVLRRSIGHVPQRDVLFDTLSVERTLHYVGRLRLPSGTPGPELNRVVSEVIDTIGLREQSTTQFRQLSGGQQKRLSLGMELITKPSFIFLDEPTSPLDPQTTENMMEMFRWLADGGRIVVMVTHRFERFNLMHRVAILTSAGRLAFFGPPREALEYFGCREPGEIYRRIESGDPDELSNRFKASPLYARYVGAAIVEAQELARTDVQARIAGKPKKPVASRQFGVGQWLTLTRRCLEVKLNDTRNTAMLLAQAPIVALLLALITGDAVNDSRTLFIAAVISIWFGANNAVREIVAEAPVYVRERMVNLKIPSYALSKFAVLSVLALIQCLLFVSILVAFRRFNGSDFVSLSLVLYLTALGGISMGLFFSAVVNSADKAMTVLPLILIPQLLLSGFLKPIDDLYVNRQTSKPATVEEFRSASPSQVIKSYDGLGAARYAAAAIVARWSLDALAHAVSVGDKKAREQLALNMTVAEYEQVAKGQSETDIGRAFEDRVKTDLAIMAGFIILFLAMTGWALKRKDVF
jgi:ABC-type multidrug transport system ATPase subunit/pSer/pThr/pTyr-binding forkhead associated (FHA) protein/ABC-type transport system involved in multi-copper enzyme maturation permease subunit